jgi:hypothetical protein
MGRRESLAAGVLAACVVVLVYLRGAGRAFSYDASVTVANFVRTPSLLDPFRRQVVYNNHVAFSFLEHVVYTVSGSASERTMRVLPIVCAACCVGIIVGFIAARTGMWAGVIAGALLATNPMFAAMATDVRGYSLLCLCGVVSTVALLKVESSESTLLDAVYVGFLALGLATHLYMLFVIAGHIVFVVSRRETNTMWAIRWMAALVLGGGAYLGIASSLRSTAPGGGFHAEFPRDLAVEFLGHEALAVVVAGLGLGITLWSIRQRREFKALGLFFTAVLVGLWVVVTPPLFPRYFVWAMPAIAVAAALGLHRLGHRNVATAAVVLACVGAFNAGIGAQSTDEIANRSAVPLITAAQARGKQVCGLGSSTEALGPYAHHIPAVYTREALFGCDLVIALDPAQYPDLIAQARGVFSRHARLPAESAGIAFFNG